MSKFSEVVVNEKEFVKRVAPLVFMKGEKYKRMQAQQTYMILKDVGFIVIDRKRFSQYIDRLVELLRA